MNSPIKPVAARMSDLVDKLQSKWDYFDSCCQEAGEAYMDYITLQSAMTDIQKAVNNFVEFAEKYEPTP
jgi:hypothetical protein